MTGMLYDVVANGGPGFTSIQEHLIGGNCGGHNQKCLPGGPPVTMNAAYTSAQEFDGYQEGYDNSDTNPTAQTSQWDYLPQTAQEVEQQPQNVQGGFGQGYQQTTLTPQQAQKGETLQQLGQQAQKNGSGYINFGSNTSGITGTSTP